MDERYEKGLKLRGQVLGGTQVASRVSKAQGTVSASLQEHLTSFVWGDIWAREGLGLRERSMVTVAMLTALKSEVELRTHVKAAIGNGVTVQEIEEILLHSAAYTGFPSAMAAFRIAREALAELEAANAAAE